MTPSEMEAEIKNLNEWAREIAQNLPLLATKEDLKVYATKEDLKVYATKEDLKAYATKEDLRNEVAKLATKQDLKAFATKDELRAGLDDAKRYTANLIFVTRREIRQVDGKLTSMAADVQRIAEHLAILTA